MTLYSTIHEDSLLSSIRANMEIHETIRNEYMYDNNDDNNNDAIDEAL